jgi:hypothetical protein
LRHLTVAVEGVHDAAVISKILKTEGFEPTATYGLKGKNHLDRSLGGYNNAARFSPWLVVRDLDQDADCGGALASVLLPGPSQWMRFRIAVRETEAWLMADPDTLAAFLRVKRSHIPEWPDTVADPKQAMVNLARRSTRATIVGDMVPSRGLSGVVGPGYTARISEFALEHWRPEVASQRSPSLSQCVLRLRELAQFAPIRQRLNNLGS